MSERNIPAVFLLSVRLWVHLCVNAPVCVCECVCVYVCTYFPYMHAGKLMFLLLMLAHCVCRWCVRCGSWKLACVCASELYLVLLLLLLTQVAAVGVVFDNVLAHVIHSVHQKLKALLQVIAGRKMSACQSHIFVLPSAIVRSNDKHYFIFSYV